MDKKIEDYLLKESTDAGKYRPYGCTDVVTIPLLCEIIRRAKKAKEKDECKHNPILSKMSYLDAHAEAERRIKRGQKQKQCPNCKLWFFKDEMNPLKPTTDERPS